MTKAQALALVTAIEGRAIPCSAHLTFSAGGEAWTVTIDATAPLSGADLSALANYCAANGLTVSATFSYLGVS